LSLSIGQNRADQGLKAARAALFLQFERVDISDTILAMTQILTDGALILNELRKVACILQHTTKQAWGRHRSNSATCGSFHVGLLGSPAPTCPYQI
jgi:hypothetical protein